MTKKYVETHSRIYDLTTEDVQIAIRYYLEECKDEYITSADEVSINFDGSAKVLVIDKETVREEKDVI